MVITTNRHYICILADLFTRNLTVDLSSPTYAPPPSIKVQKYVHPRVLALWEVFALSRRVSTLDSLGGVGVIMFLLSKIPKGSRGWHPAVKATAPDTKALAEGKKGPMRDILCTAEATLSAVCVKLFELDTNSVLMELLRPLRDVSSARPMDMTATMGDSMAFNGFSERRHHSWHYTLTRVSVQAYG